MDQRRGFELGEMIGGAAPLAEERLERDDRADRLLGEFGLVMGGLAGGDLGVDPRELAPQGAGGNGRCPHARQSPQCGASALAERLDRRHLGIGGIEPLDGHPETVENPRHAAPIEAAGELVEPASAALGLEGVELLELVEAEGHDGREGALVDIPHVILEEERRCGAAIGG